ncbi:MAG: cupredoxin domain-containing protein [Dehalococcoidia bacterium]
MRLLSLVAAILLTAALLAACADDDSGDETTADASLTEAAATSQAAAPVQPEPAQEVDDEVTAATDDTTEVRLQDNQFEPNNLGVPLGGAVTFFFTNDDSAQHSFRVAGIDGQYDTEDDAAIESIGPGNVGQLTFSGAAPGEFTFRCDFHPGSMGGVITVE